MLYSLKMESTSYFKGKITTAWDLPTAVLQQSSTLWVLRTWRIILEVWPVISWVTRLFQCFRRNPLIIGTMFTCLTACGTPHNELGKIQVSQLMNEVCNEAGVQKSTATCVPQVRNSLLPKWNTRERYNGEKWSQHGWSLTVWVSIRGPEHCFTGNTDCGGWLQIIHFRVEGRTEANVYRSSNKHHSRSNNHYWLRYRHCNNLQLRMQ